MDVNSAVPGGPQTLHRRRMDESWARARSLAEQQHWLLTAEQAWRAGLSPGQVSWRLSSGEGLWLLRGGFLLHARHYDRPSGQTLWGAGPPAPREGPGPFRRAPPP